MGTGVVTIEPVESKTALRRFTDVPYILHRRDPRWSPEVRAYESWRLDARRHPYFDRGDAAYLLARRDGHPVGRIAAHRQRAGDVAGWFGFFDGPDDPEVTRALLDAARTWLEGEGATSMTGPVSWQPDEEFGVPVDGVEHRGLTGRPWRPGWYAEQLAAAGLEPGAVRHTYRLAVSESGVAPVEPAGTEPPPHAGRYADPALVLDRIAAVPDVSALLSDASIRSAWRIARRAKERRFETAVCVRCDGPPEDLVPGLLATAERAGYRWVVAPWAPAGHAPETAHQVFSLVF